MNILGLNAFHGDSEAALLQDGVLVAAAEEERFRRLKHWAGFPARAIAYCLHEAGLTLADIDHIAVNQNNRANSLRKIRYLIAKRPSILHLRDRLANRRRRMELPELLAKEFSSNPRYHRLIEAFRELTGVPMVLNTSLRPRPMDMRMPKINWIALMKLYAVLGLLLSLAVGDSAFAATRIRDDMGGSLGKYLLMFTRMRDSGERVIIDGNCFSACTLVTILPKERICVTQRAVLGFHAGWIDDQTGKRPTSAEGTGMLFELYPPAIRNWIANHGGLGTRTILLKGRELMTFYPACDDTHEAGP